MAAVLNLTSWPKWRGLLLEWRPTMRLRDGHVLLALNATPHIAGVISDLALNATDLLATGDVPPMPRRLARRRVVELTPLPNVLIRHSAINQITLAEGMITQNIAGVRPPSADWVIFACGVVAAACARVRVRVAGDSPSDASVGGRP